MKFHLPFIALLGLIFSLNAFADTQRFEVENLGKILVSKMLHRLYYPSLNTDGKGHEVITESNYGDENSAGFCAWKGYKAVVESEVRPAPLPFDRKDLFQRIDEFADHGIENFSSEEVSYLEDPDWLRIGFMTYKQEGTDIGNWYRGARTFKETKALCASRGARISAVSLTIPLEIIVSVTCTK